MAIHVIYGHDVQSMVMDVLHRMNATSLIPKNARIGIKPNLVVPKPHTSGATTDPAIVAGIIEYLRDQGYDNIAILEGSWVGARTADAFKACGYTSLSKRYNVPLIDLQKDAGVECSVDGMSLTVCKSMLDIDYLINVPVLKGHCQTLMTCALKNLKGCIPDSEKRRYHTIGLHRPIAYLNKALRQDLIIVDGMMGDLDFEEGGNPMAMNRIIAGTDSVQMDAYVADLMGVSITDVPYITLAEKLGVGSCRIDDVREYDQDKKRMIATPSRRNPSLTRWIDERDACSACYGCLMHALKRLEDGGRLRSLPDKIHIGQAYQGQILDGIGVGVCTKGCAVSVPGCPPTAKDILLVLDELTHRG